MNLPGNTFRLKRRVGLALSHERIWDLLKNKQRLRYVLPMCCFGKEKKQVSWKILLWGFAMFFSREKKDEVLRVYRLRFETKKPIVTFPVSIFQVRTQSLASFEVVFLTWDQLPSGKSWAFQLHLPPFQATGILISFHWNWRVPGLRDYIWTTIVVPYLDLIKAFFWGVAGGYP